MNKYIIQLQSNPSLCLGVLQASAGQPVVLSLLQGSGNANTQWEIDPNTGVITLASSAGLPAPLVFDITGVSPGNNTPIIVANEVLGRPSQSWNVVGNPPYIQNNGTAQLCIDDGNDATPGEPVILYQQQNGNPNQMYQILSVPALERHQAAVAHAGNHAKR